MIIIITMLHLSSILTMDFLTLKAIASLPNVNTFLCGHTEGNCGYVGTHSRIQLKWKAQPLHLKTSSNCTLRTITSSKIAISARIFVRSQVACRWPYRYHEVLVSNIKTLPKLRILMGFSVGDGLILEPFWTF